MKALEIIEHLKTLESESTKKIFLKHGAKEPFYGVKVEELKKIQKKIKKDYTLSMELYDSGISDAMYLAGLIADETKMAKTDLQQWVDKAYWYMLSEYPVAWVAAESKFGHQLALDWIASDKENVASSGWAALSGIVAIEPDAKLDIEELKLLLGKVENSIHEAPNRVRYTMNNFVIAVGCYVSNLTDEALEVAQKIGRVHVNMGDTACKVPDAQAYINKVKQTGKVGKKRRSARC